MTMTVLYTHNMHMSVACVNFDLEACVHLDLRAYSMLLTI